MSAAVALERCWNHAAREAVCRCPGCARYYRRECVTVRVAGLVARPRCVGLLFRPAAGDER